MGMHIPKSSTCESEVLTFEEAMRGSGSGTYDPGKWLYVPDFYSEYRYILGTIGSDPLICIGINPSTAEPDNLDNTLKSVSRIAAGNGYDSWTMFNVYAQRATRPEDLDLTRSEKLHEENMKAFLYVLSRCGDRPPSVWAAWGAIIEKRGWLRDCVRDMVSLGERYGAVWYTAGKRSAKGHPHHPLYLKKDSPLEAFDILGYLDSLS